MTRDDNTFLRSYFPILSGTRGPPVPILYSRGYCQADVVLALLRGDRIAAVEELIGKKITRLPPDPRIAMVPAPVHPPDKTLDDRRVIRVGPNPRLPTTPAFQRYRWIRPGLSVGQLISRGVTRRDIRQLSRSGHVVLR